MAIAVDTTHQMYFADVEDLVERDLDQLKILSNKAMEAVWKEHMMGFHKCLPMCDPSLGPSFLQEVQVHYDINLELKMLIEKLQMLMSTCVSNKQKL
jgi:hypothetical protein